MEEEKRVKGEGKEVAAEALDGKVGAKTGGEGRGGEGRGE